MKRLTLNVDLEENEIFEKEVIEIIRAKAREIARNHQVCIIEEAVSAEIRRLFSNDCYGTYRSQLKKIVEGCIYTQVREFLSHEDINKIAEEELTKQMDFIISRTTSEAEEKCVSVLNKTISNEVMKKMNDILHGVTGGSDEKI